MKISSTIIALVMAIGVTTAFSANDTITEANQITLKNNDTANVAMSYNQMNRVYVNNDIITNVNCPAGFCEITYNKDDANGSLYIKYNTDKPFTYFISTKDGYHFGVRVQPQISKKGDTIAFNLLGGNTKQVESETSSDYSQLIIKRMTNMVKEQQVAGWTRMPIKATKGNTMAINGVKVEPLFIYKGSRFNGFVSIISNTTKHTVAINESEFYVTGNRAIAINKQTLKPKQTAMLYVLK